MFPTRDGGYDDDDEIIDANVASDDQDTDAGDEGDASQPRQRTDWKAEAARLKAEAEKGREYERRFKGLQVKVQQEVEARRSAEARLASRDASMAAAQIAQLPPEQQPAAMLLLQAEQETRRLQFDRQIEQETMWNTLKEQTLDELAGKHPGVSREKLSRFNSRIAMEEYIADIEEARGGTAKAASRRQRAEAKADTFEGGGTPVAPRKPIETFDDAREALKAALTRRK